MRVVASELGQLDVGDQQVLQRLRRLFDRVEPSLEAGEPVVRVAEGDDESTVLEHLALEVLVATSPQPVEVAGPEHLEGERVRDHDVADLRGHGVGGRPAVGGPAAAGDAGADPGEGLLEVDARVRGPNVAGHVLEHREPGQQRLRVAGGPAGGEGQVGGVAEGERGRADPAVQPTLHEVAPGAGRHRGVQRRRRVTSGDLERGAEQAHGHGLVRGGVAEHPVGGDLQPRERDLAVGSGRRGEQAQHRGVGHPVEAVERAGGLEQVDVGIVDPRAGQRGGHDVRHGLERVLADVEAPHAQQGPAGGEHHGGEHRRAEVEEVGPCRVEAREGGVGRRGPPHEHQEPTSEVAGQVRGTGGEADGQGAEPRPGHTGSNGDVRHVRKLPRAR